MIRIKYILLILNFFTLYCYTQVEEQIIPLERKQYTAITEPATLYKGNFRFGLTYEQIFVKKVFNEKSEKYTLPGSVLSQLRSLILVVQYGLSDRLQINFTLPVRFDYIQQSVFLESPLFIDQMILKRDQKGKGLGDISLGICGQIIQEKEEFPSITARGTFIIPTGRKDITNVIDQYSFDLPTGLGELRLDFDFMARKIVYPYSYKFIAGIQYHFGGDKIIEPGGESIPFKTGNLFYATAGINFHLNDWFSVANELTYQYIGNEKIDGIYSDINPWIVIYQPYIHFQIKQLRFVQSVGIPLKGKLTFADPNYLFILQYIL